MPWEGPGDRSVVPPRQQRGDDHSSSEETAVCPLPLLPSNPTMVFQCPNGTEELMADGWGALPVGSVLQSTV